VTHGRLPLRWVAVAATVLATGCATVPHPNPADPWEGWNRGVQSFNDAVDDAVVAPVARAYRDVVPSFLRTGIGNFFGNLADAWSAVNHLLQGKPEPAATMTMRFALNSSFGLLGVLDIASEAGLEREPEDFGQTLGRWGLGPGPYLVWPLLGPSTVRDSVGLPLDLAATSPSHVGVAENDLGWTGVLQVVHVRSTLLGASKLLDSIALDRYAFLRDAYLARRRNLVYDGDPPEPAPDDDAAPARAASGASTPPK